jgi:anti-anti-sigma factor
MTTTRHPTQSLDILISPLDTGGLLVTVNGDLDALNVDYFAGRIGDLLDRSAPTLIELNLAGVEFIDAAAAGRLRRLHRLAADAGCVLSIGAATQFAWWLFSSVGLASIFPVPARYRTASEPGS